MPASADLGATRRAMRWHLLYRPRHYVIWAVEAKSRKGDRHDQLSPANLREKRVDIGWLILPRHQGKGYMTEAGQALLRHLFDDLKVHKVEALIQRDNKPSVALAKRLGFRLEGGPIRDRWSVERQVA